MEILAPISRRPLQFFEKLRLPLLSVCLSRPARCDVARNDVVGLHLRCGFEFFECLVVIALRGVLVAADQVRRDLLMLRCLCCRRKSRELLSPTASSKPQAHGLCSLLLHPLSHLRSSVMRLVSMSSTTGPSPLRARARSSGRSDKCSRAWESFRSLSRCGRFISAKCQLARSVNAAPIALPAMPGQPRQVSQPFLARYVASRLSQEPLHPAVPFGIEANPDFRRT